MPDDFVKDEFGAEVRAGDYVITHLMTSAKNFVIKEVLRVFPKGNQVEIELDDLDYYFGNHITQKKQCKRNIFIKASQEQIDTYTNGRRARRKREIEQTFYESNMT